VPPVVAAIELKTELNELPRLAKEVDRFCDSVAASDPDRFALQVALEEVVMNVINHGFKGQPGHAVHINLSSDERAVTVVARDDAPAYDPLARAEVDTSLALEDRPVGGLGVHLVKKLMQEARYERRDDTNVLTLVRHITPTA
jgi:anti-sigma regulatory factor (Ser/Thr protein kinase)